MTKPIIVVKICYKLLYVIQVTVVKNILIVTSWPQLISKFLVSHKAKKKCSNATTE